MPADRARLERGGFCRVLPHDHGAFVHVNLDKDDGPAEQDANARAAGYSPAMLACLAYARAAGCWWINFDTDAEPLDVLPTYPEEPAQPSRSTLGDEARSICAYLLASHGGNQDTLIALLDEMTHDAQIANASDVNNQGPEAQIAALLAAGVNANTIRDMVKGDATAPTLSPAAVHWFSVRCHVICDGSYLASRTVYVRANTAGMAELAAKDHAHDTWPEADTRIDYRIDAEEAQECDETDPRFNRPETVFTDDGRTHPST